MKKFMYKEMKKSINQIRLTNLKNTSADDSYHVSEGDQMLLDTVKIIFECSNFARKEGLLSLEEYVNEISEFSGIKYLKDMIMLVVGGTDPDLINEICYCRYCSSKLSNYGALQYLIMLAGILDIQQSENPRVIEEKLKYMLPEELADEYIRIRNENDEECKRKHRKEGDIDLSILDKVCEGGIAVNSSDDYYYTIRMTNHMLLELDDRSIQRLLRDVDNSDLAYAMKAISGKARRRVFDNLSKRLALMIAEDMEYMGPVKLEDAGGANRKIFTTMVRLISAGEIIVCEDTILEEMATVFLNLEDEKPTSESVLEAQMAENKLYGLWNEYLSHTHKLIELPYLL